MKSVFFAYSKAIERAAQLDQVGAILGNDRVVVLYDSVNEADLHLPHDDVQALLAKSLLYVNYWGASYPTQAGRGRTWFPGPQDLAPGPPLIRSPKGPYPYKMDAQFDADWLFSCLKAIRTVIGVEGLFVDDFTPNVNWWQLTDEEKAIVWPGWRPGDWRQMQVAEVERLLRGFMDAYQKKVVVNGRARRLGPRLWEDVGVWEHPNNIVANAMPDDMLLVKGLKADGKAWATVPAGYEAYGGFKAGTSFSEVWKVAMGIAQVKGLYLGLAYRERPLQGGSTCGFHDFVDPASWPGA